MKKCPVCMRGRAVVPAYRNKKGTLKRWESVQDPTITEYVCQRCVIAAEEVKASVPAGK